MVQFEPEADASSKAEGLHVGARQLEPAGLVEDRVLLARDLARDARAGIGPVDRLRARPAIPDRDGPLHVPGDQRVVGHEQDRRLELAVDPAQHLEQLRGAGAIQLAGGLVGEEHTRPVRQRHRDRDLLLLAAGQAAGPEPRAIAIEAHEVEELARPRGPSVRPAPSSSNGSSTFSTDERYGSRLRSVCCQTKPMTRRR